MIDAITRAFVGPTPIALAAAFAWGALSVFLSPCHLGSIPLIIAYVNNGAVNDRRRAFLFSTLFASGLLITLSAVGVATSLAGRLIGDIGAAIPLVTASFIVLSGFWLMDIPPFTRINLAFTAKPRRRGAWGAFILGLAYGIILGPCSFAFLAPMLALVFSAGGSEAAFGASLMAAYAVGHSGAIVAAGTFGDFFGSVLKKKISVNAAMWAKRLCGALVACAGAYQIITIVSRSVA